MGWLSSVGKIAAAPFTGGLSLVSGSGSNGMFSSLTGRKGEQQQQNDISQGYGEAKNQLESKYPIAQQQYTSGINNAKKAYQTPEIVSSRQELYNRVLGNGGYSPETVNFMKGNAIEQAGTQMRDVENALNDRYGDSTGSGLTGENLARALTTIGANKANALRDVDLENAKLSEQEQTDAIPMLYQDANTQAGLEQALGSGQAGLTTEEAQMLAELAAGKGAAMAGTRDTTNWLGNIAANGINSAISAGSKAAFGG